MASDESDFATTTTLLPVVMVEDNDDGGPTGGGGSGGGEDAPAVDLLGLSPGQQALLESAVAKAKRKHALSPDLPFLKQDSWQDF